MTARHVGRFPDFDEEARLFEGDCGHVWVGAMSGDFTCPVCGRHEGDHHLVREQPVAIQLRDLGSLWRAVANAADEAAEHWPARGT
jgi:hypothetical protein